MVAMRLLPPGPHIFVMKPKIYGFTHNARKKRLIRARLVYHFGHWQFTLCRRKPGLVGLWQILQIRSMVTCLYRFHYLDCHLRDYGISIRFELLFAVLGLGEFKSANFIDPPLYNYIYYPRSAYASLGNASRVCSPFRHDISADDALGTGYPTI